MNEQIRENIAQVDLRKTLRMSFQKLLPQHALKNPVMAVVWLATILSLILTFSDVTERWFGFSVAVILFLTVIFANFAEAIAEARGRGQAASLRAARKDLVARFVDAKGQQIKVAPASILKRGDLVLVKEGEIIPADGEIVRGVASVSEAAVTGESAPVLREAGTDHSSVIGGTRVLSDEIVVEISNEPGHSFLDRMISMVEGASRQKTPNEVALGLLLNVMTLTFLIVVVSLPWLARPLSIDVDPVVLIALLVCLIPTTIGGLLPAIGIAGMNRALKHNVLAKSGKAVEVAGDVNVLILDKTGTITFGDRMATHMTAIGSTDPEDLRVAALAASLKDPTPEGKSIVKLADVSRSSKHGDFESATFIPFSAVTRMSGVDLPEGTSIRKGAAEAVKQWCEEQGGKIPETVDSIVKDIASRGSTPLLVARGATILGAIELSDVIKPGIRERFARLRAMGIETVMVTGDNPITAAAIAAKAGVDDYMAQARPEDKLKRIRDEQEAGNLVAMVGDGTNDAPALAQADVGLAMNSGTQAAKEAGNMVDLDSNPTKLLEVVEIGKQQLITRGALTTFSLANDVSKYFAILPALFVAAIPGLSALNVMQLGSPQSAVLSALIFNALVIPALIPLALKGVQFKVGSANQMLRRNMAIYGFGGVLLPFVAIKIIDLLVTQFVHV